MRDEGKIKLNIFSLYAHLALYWEQGVFILYIPQVSLRLNIKPGLLNPRHVLSLSYSITRKRAGSGNTMPTVMSM